MSVFILIGYLLNILVYLIVIGGFPKENFIPALIVMMIPYSTSIVVIVYLYAVIRGTIDYLLYHFVYDEEQKMKADMRIIDRYMDMMEKVNKEKDD